MEPLFKAEAMLAGLCHVGCHWQEGAKKGLYCVADPGHRGLPRSCGAHLALCSLAVHESVALLELPQASSQVPAQPPLLPRAEGQLFSPCADRYVLISFPDERFDFKVTQRCWKTTSVWSTRCMVTLLCFQNTIFSLLNRFNLARQLALPKFR